MEVWSVAKQEYAYYEWNHEESTSKQYVSEGIHESSPRVKEEEGPIYSEGHESELEVVLDHDPQECAVKD